MKIRFVRGVTAGDDLRFMRRVTSKRPSSKPGRGVIFIQSEIVDQKTRDPILTSDEVVLIARRGN